MGEGSSHPPAEGATTANETTTTGVNNDHSSGFFGQILTPGSSLHPTFLLILDGAFALLLCVFIGLLFLTGGNIHILALIGIEGGLWASVKWVIYELKNAPLPTAAESSSSDTKTKEE